MKCVGGHRRHRQHRGGEEEDRRESVPGMKYLVFGVGVQRAVAAAGRRQGAEVDDRSFIGSFVRANQGRFDGDSGSWSRCERTDEEPIPLYPPVHKQTANSRAYGPGAPETTRRWSSISFFPADKWDDWNSPVHLLTRRCTSDDSTFASCNSFVRAPNVRDSNCALCPSFLPVFLDS